MIIFSYLHLFIFLASHLHLEIAGGRLHAIGL